MNYITKSCIGQLINQSLQHILVIFVNFGLCFCLKEHFCGHNINKIYEGMLTCPSSRAVARQQITWWMSTVSGQSADSNSFGHDVPVSLTDERSHDLIAANDAQTDKPAMSSVKPAPPGGSEFLSGMMNANSPHGLVPKFPSWSLLSLGKYSSYSSTSGKISPSWEQVLVW